MIAFCDIKESNLELEHQLSVAFQRVLRSGSLIMGNELSSFEREFALYCNSTHCIGVGNGLDALALSLQAAGITENDEVLVPSQTFIATWLAVSMIGAKPVPVEINTEDHAIDVREIEKHITTRTKAIIPVHLFGLPADMD